MTAMNFIFLLAVMSAFSLVIYGGVRLLDLTGVGPASKIRLLKMAVMITLVAPLFFVVLRPMSVKVIELPENPISVELAMSSFSKVAPQPTPVKPWPLHLMVFYGLGCGFMILKLATEYFRTRRWLAGGVPGMIQDEEVLFSDKIQSPLSFGLLKTEIYFPIDTLQKWTERETQMSLAHEKGHIQQGDFVWKFMSLLAQALLFFAPWAYALHRKLELEMEIRCDEHTCSKTQAKAEEYGLLLLAMVSQAPSTKFLANHITDSTLKRRILAMKSRKIQRPVLVAMLTVLMSLVGAAAVATSSGVAQSKAFYHLAAKISVNGQLVSTPHLITGEGQLASISQGDASGNTEIELSILAKDMPTPDRADAISLEMGLRYREGTQVSHEKFKLILTPGKEGQLSFSQNGQTYEMSMIVDRK